MSIQDLGALGELIAAIATVGTLVYLAIQIRSNTKSMETASRQSVANEFREFNKFSLEYGRDWITGLKIYPSMDFEPRQHFATMFHDLLLFFQSVQALYESGSLDEATYFGYRNFIATCISTPGGAEFWEEWRSTYTRGMADSLDQRLAEGPFEETILDKPMNRLDEADDA